MPAVLRWVRCCKKRTGTGWNDQWFAHKDVGDIFDFVVERFGSWFFVAHKDVADKGLTTQ